MLNFDIGKNATAILYILCNISCGNIRDSVVVYSLGFVESPDIQIYFLLHKLCEMKVITTQIELEKQSLLTTLYFVFHKL